MLNLSRSLLRARTARSAFSTLVIPSPNSPSSDLGSLLTASSQLPSPVDILQIASTDQVDSVSRQVHSIASAPDIGSLFVHAVQDMDDNCYFQCLESIKRFVSERGHYTHVVMGNGLLAKELLPRLAVANHSQCISDIIAILDPLRFQRPIYAGNAISTVRATLSGDSGSARLTSRPSLPRHPKHQFCQAGAALRRHQRPPGPGQDGSRRRGSARVGNQEAIRASRPVREALFGLGESGRFRRKGA